MILKQRTQEEINKRCEKLESLGFVCTHNDIEVFHPEWDFLTFDFSAVNLEDPACIMNHLIRSVYDHALRAGETNTQAKIKRALGL